jgi:hypothetical protein
MPISPCACWRKHKESLHDEARELLGHKPDAKVSGLVLDSESSDGQQMMAAIGKAMNRDTRGENFVGLVSRDFALAILRANGPATQDWLESDPGLLPLVCATKHGFRLGAARL